MLINLKKSYHVSVTRGEGNGFKNTVITQELLKFQ